MLLVNIYFGEHVKLLFLLPNKVNKTDMRFYHIIIALWAKCFYERGDYIHKYISWRIIKLYTRVFPTELLLEKFFCKWWHCEWCWCKLAEDAGVDWLLLFTFPLWWAERLLPWRFGPGLPLVPWALLELIFIDLFDGLRPESLAITWRWMWTEPEPMTDNFFLKLWIWCLVGFYFRALQI